MMRLKYEELSDIKKNFIIFVVFFILILLFLVSFFQNETNETNEYEQTYSGAFEIISQTGVTKDFEAIEVATTERKKYDLIIKELRNKIREKNLKLTSATDINYLYNPLEIEEYLTKSNKISDISEVIFSKLFKEKNLKFYVDFYKSKTNIRGRYQYNTIKIFDVKNLPQEEFLSVFIHELGHYFDIKYLEKQVIFDLSDNFYNISWKGTKILKNGSDKFDFVSGYAMTNKYEDFSETFTYYILYNNDFREKMLSSSILEKKYDFFSKYIFRNDEFKKTNFRIFEKNLDYYWDTTKIKFSVKNFLEYLKNGI